MANIIIPGVTTIGEERLINGTSSDDQIMIMGSVLASGQGRNVIDTLQGSDTVVVSGELRSSGDQSSNEIRLGNGNSTLYATGALVAEDKGVNTITHNLSPSVEGAIATVFASDITAASGGINRLGSDWSLNALHVGQLSATAGGQNILATSGSDPLLTGYAIRAEFASGSWLADGENSSNSVVQLSRGSGLIEGDLVARNGGENAYFMADSLSASDVTINGSLISQGGSNTVGGLSGSALNFGRDITINGDLLAQLDEQIGETAKAINTVKSESAAHAHTIITGSVSAVGGNASNDINEQL